MKGLDLVGQKMKASNRINGYSSLYGITSSGNEVSYLLHQSLYLNINWILQINYSDMCNKIDVLNKKLMLCDDLIG